MPGYSKRTLTEKLGFKPGNNIYIENPIENLFDLLYDLPENVHINKTLEKEPDLILYFINKKAEFISRIKVFRKSIKQNGSIWTCWKKNRPKVKSEINENQIREYVLDIGLVDIKVIAVNETWSGLKLVIRKDKRE